jgi:uncharacterized protein
LIYLDSSALVKMVFQERESADLQHWLLLNDQPLVTNLIGRVELMRVCRRFSLDDVAAGRGLLADISVMPLTDSTVELAEDVSPPGLRSLDALHLASALDLGDDLSSFVVYDKRLRDAGVFAGLPVRTPGAA